MKLLFLFLLISGYTFAQVNENLFFAVINDKDGYVNVRKEANIHSKVIKKLDNNTLIFAFDYNTSEDGNWIYADNDGYIYNDRVKWIEKLPKVAKGIEKKNAIHFSGKNIKVTLTSQKFDKSKHSFLYYKEPHLFGEQMARCQEKNIKIFKYTSMGNKFPSLKALMMTYMNLLSIQKTTLFTTIKNLTATI